MSTPQTDEWYLAALWHHILPLCEEVPPPVCVCGTMMTLVPPEDLFFCCRECHPETYDWSPDA